MNVIERLVVKLVGDSSSFNKMMDNAKGKALGLAKGMISVGTMLTKYVTLPLLALGAVSVSAFAQFDKAMTESLSIMQVTQAETAKMTQLALNLGQQGVQGPEKLAQAYFYLASAGMNAQQSMAALPTVQAFATAGNFDLAKATDLVTDAQSALGLEMDKQGKNMKRVSDVFVAANTLANATVEQFSTAITTKAGASMRAFGKDVEEGVAVLAAFADQGVKAELAGNALDRMLRLLATSAIDNADAHARLGFKVYDASGNMRNMADIIQNLESILEGMSDKQRTATLTALGFEARVQQVILPLLGASEAVRSYEERLRDMSGITEEVANKQMKSFYNQTVRLYNQMKVLAIQIGQVLAPYVQWLADQVAVAVKWFTSMDEVQQRWIIGLGAAAAAAGPLLVVTGLLVGAFALFGAEIIAITAYLASWALVAGVWLGAAAAGIYLGNVIAQNSKAMRDYNDAVKENMRLEGKVVERLAARQQGQLDKAAGLSGANKNSFVNQAIASEQKELEGYQEQVRRAKQRVDELNTSWNSATGNKILEEAKLELDQARAKADMTERHIQSLKDTLEKPVQDNFSHHGNCKCTPYHLKTLILRFLPIASRMFKNEDEEEKLPNQTSHGYSMMSRQNLNKFNQMQETGQSNLNSGKDQSKHKTLIGNRNKKDSSQESFYNISSEEQKQMEGNLPFLNKNFKSFKDGSEGDSNVSTATSYICLNGGKIVIKGNEIETVVP